VPANNMGAVGRARGGIIGYADGGDVDPTLYDEMGKQYLPGQPLPEGWQTLTNAPRKIQLPFNPAGEEFAGELREMERTRRENSTRTIPEFLSDFTFSRSNTAKEALRSPLPALLQSLVDSGSMSNQEAVNELQKILSGPKGMGQRGRWNRENPNFASKLEAGKESRERVLDAQEEGMARGGVVGYAKGGMPQDGPKTKAYRPQSAIPVGNSNQPIPMLMEKYGAKRVNQFIAEQKRLNDKARALAEAGSAAGSMQIEDHKLMKEIFSEKYRDILNESMGMARGGIVGYAPGGRIKGFEERVVVADEQVRAYLSSLGRDITDFTAEQIAAVKDMLNSQVARSQNDIMSQVGRGAMGAIADAETAMSQGQIGAREAQLESGRGGIGAALSNLGSMVNSEDAQAARQELQQVMQGTNREPSVTDQLLAADLRRRAENNPTDEERAQGDKYNPVAYQQRLREQDMGRRDPNYGQQEALVPPNEGGGIRNALKGIFNSDDAAAARQELQQAMQGTGSRGQESEGGPSLYERTKGYMPDFGALAGTDVMEFLVGMGLDDVAQKVMDSGFMSGVPTIEEMTTPIPEGAGGSYKAGARLTDLATAPYNVLSGFLHPTEGDWATLGDAVGGIEDFGRGVVGADPRRDEVIEDIQQVDTETDANGVPTDTLTESVVERLPSVRAGDLDAVVGSSATTPVASSATTPVSGFTADQTDRFGKMMQGIKDENFLNEYIGTISPNDDAGTGATTQKTGLAGLLQKVKPYADKASDIAKILGRGAGASEGFEFSQIAQKSAEREAEDRLAARNAEIADKLFGRQTERDTAGFEQQKVLEEMGIEGRNQELTRRLEAASNIAGQELRMDLYETVLTQMRSGLDAQYNMLVEQLEKDPKFTTGGSDFIPFNERFDQAAFTNALIDLEEEYVKNKLSAASAYTGGSPPSTSTVPATERYSVI